jgi:SagB-type dehydrogenase family enzyme
MQPNRAGGEHNEETDRLFAYQQATKHTYQSVRANARFLDWRNQPNPFRTYEGAPLIALPPASNFPEANAFATMSKLGKECATSEGRPAQSGEPVLLDVYLVSRLLWYSMAVSAWKRVPGTGVRYSLRVNPSSGNLHPTETHLAINRFSVLESGLYHYRADLHALELRSRGNWTHRLAESLDLPWTTNSALIVALTSIFWREAWKYGDRAYRYCCHDLGHAMMSLLLAAQALGISGGVATHFSDLRLARTLGLADSDEAPMAFLIFRGEHPSEQLPVPSDEQFVGVPNELSREELPYHLLLGFHQSTILPDPPGPLPCISPEQTGGSDLKFTEEVAESHQPSRDAPLARIVRRRRSALDFNPQAPPIDRCDLDQLLDYATRDWHADWRGNFDGEVMSDRKGGDLVTLYLYLHRVRDREPGVYRWDRRNRVLEQLHRANVERIAAFLSLEQALAGNACFAISMIANLAEAARRFGNRGYRYAHFEAGAIGQRLYVGAEALGFRATGIGAFYDDDVHRYLGFLEEGESSVDSKLREAERAAVVMLNSPSSRQAVGPNQIVESAQGLPRAKSPTLPMTDPKSLPNQVIYHFAVGHAIPDPRVDAEAEEATNTVS